MSWRPLADLRLYYRSPRPDVMEHVPPETRTMLDVGCGAGAFGLNVRSQYGAEVWGIELEPEPAEHAKDRLNHVFVGDAMELLPTMPKGKFDLVSYTDVLEHLVHPELALAYTKPLLSEKGYVLASLPNIRYWEEFKRVVFDADWPQEDSGIFDRTHLRFFTEKSIRRFFEQNGWTIVKLVGLNPTMSKKLRLINLLTGNRYLDSQYLQFLVLARPTRSK